ncbi:hypothetical protein ABHP49_005776 [Bacillus cereus]|uniref:6-aminohexanoate hydrolase n=3 Tax=Bacillus thuringiensis TaxID=1428 RepID=A0AAW9GQW0_BACTU|nr:MULTISPECIES: hypothetical protein [Bacillus cereus group]MCU7392881.1 hypothetical protein [Bacillus sp. ST24]ANE89321.1 hypothetical protein DA68_26950 [Bacillus cereus]ASJ51661.1 hypothetical protein BA204_26755 [Bacillus cereus]EHL67752.1 hypothetical protein HMPREF1014_04859 [Bacillus sp. 7_6_55CFAA_CT2]EJQ02185.1 hypothetical protein IE1_05374 [Bacillus cereus BAG3O-2]
MFFIFEQLDYWLSLDILYFNIFTAITGGIWIISFILLILLKRQIKNEENVKINSKITNYMYTSLILLLGFSVFFMPANTIYFKQYIMMMMAISLAIGAISKIYLIKRAS